MNTQNAQQRNVQLAHPSARSNTVDCQPAVLPNLDIGGYEVFSQGTAGYAHRLAHQMLDEGRSSLGRELLGRLLNTAGGTRSEHVHLQWHMAVFELETGDWDAALARFQEQILPIAAASEEALTDAPALLWRLALTAPRPVELPWEPLRATASARMRKPSEPFVEIHNLLALAGAGDRVGLDTWLRGRLSTTASASEQLVEFTAVALRAYCLGDFPTAARVLAKVAPRVAEVGGSHAQNQLFERIAQSARIRANKHNAGWVEARAA